MDKDDVGDLQEGAYLLMIAFKECNVIIAPKQNTSRLIYDDLFTH